MLCNACGLFWKHHGIYRPLTGLKSGGPSRNLSPSNGPDRSGAASSTPSQRGGPGAATIGGKREMSMRRLRAVLLAGGTSASGTTACGVDKAILKRKGIPVRTRASSAWSMQDRLTADGAPLFLQTSGGQWRSEPIYPPELQPTAGSANVRLIPAPIRESPELAEEAEGTEGGGGDPAVAQSMAHLQPIMYTMFRGRLLFIGDHVALRGDDDLIFFAIICDFWMVPSGEKYIKVQWLIPRLDRIDQIDGPRERIDPTHFSLGTAACPPPPPAIAAGHEHPAARRVTPSPSLSAPLTHALARGNLVGPMHDRSESIDAIVDVFYSPQSLSRPLEGPSLESEAEEEGDDDESPLSSLSDAAPSLADTAPSLSTTSPTGDAHPAPEDSMVAPPGSHGGMVCASAEGPAAAQEEGAEGRGYALEPLPCKALPKGSRARPSILEDVEMAYILCGMF